MNNSISNASEKQEKMRIIENSIAYARGGAYNCLDCVGSRGWNYAEGGLNCRSAYHSEIQGILVALEQIGLSAEEVDHAISKERNGLSLGLSQGTIDDCCDVDFFLKIVEGLL